MKQLEMIAEYHGVPDLKQQIIKQYLELARREVEMWEVILSDKAWSASGSEYHKKSRLDAELKVRELKKQIKLLTPR